MFTQETKYAQLTTQFYWINCLIFNLGFFGFYPKASQEMQSIFHRA